MGNRDSGWGGGVGVEGVGIDKVRKTNPAEIVGPCKCCL